MINHKYGKLHIFNTLLSKQEPICNHTSIKPSSPFVKNFIVKYIHLASKDAKYL